MCVTKLRRVHGIALALRKSYSAARDATEAVGIAEKTRNIAAEHAAERARQTVATTQLRQTPVMQQHSNWR
jgi:hypothetical protein